MKTYVEARPTTNMKNGWLCRTSYDEKNEETAPFDWDSGSSDDDDDPVLMMIQWCSRSSDDPDLMIIQWCSRSSNDPDLMMIQWWSILEDEYDLKMKMNWIWRWHDDDSDDPEKKTCDDKLCRENTFLVKRECWCICNFGIYSLVYLMYSTLMFIQGSIYNVIESCQG